MILATAFILNAIFLSVPLHAEDVAKNTAPVRTWKIAVISDMNQGYGSTAYRDSLKAAITDITSQKVDLVLSTGDMVAGQKKGLNYGAMWSSFHKHVTLPLEKEKIPLLPSAGNHDASAGEAFQNERQLYVRNFNSYKPDRFKNTDLQFISGVEQNYPLNYAMSAGPALLIALDATASGPLIHNQIEWLDEVLKKNSRFKIKIVYGHMPLYPFAFDRAHEYLGLNNTAYAKRFEKILNDNDITYFLSGHHHVFYPGKRSGSIRYISVPLLGTGQRHLLTRDRTIKNSTPEGFLYLTFNEKGEHDLKAIASPSLTEIDRNVLPPQISLPEKSAKDCKGCAGFPGELFLNKTLRSIYERLK